MIVLQKQPAAEMRKPFSRICKSNKSVTDKL